MARVTVEDCLDFVDNRFELVLLATKRARELSQGEEPKVKWEKDKPTVVALREIAEGLITRDYYREMEKQKIVDSNLESEESVDPVEDGKDSAED